MTPQRWMQIREVLDHALELMESDPGSLDEFLASGCKDNPQLRGEVESLIAAAKSPNGVLDLPLTQPPLTPDVAGYRIVGKLGEGGAAQVFEAVTEAGLHVALKVLRRGEMSARFAREARLSSLLSHPNTVKVLDVIENSEVSAIAMELVNGHPLTALISPAGMDLNVVRNIGIGICGALAEAHSFGFVHRDLKPANVMIDTAGAARVLDFGAARQFLREIPDDRTGSSTAAGDVLGTPVYMSPEQVRGEKVDSRSDIFSFGSLLCEMLTGRAPFRRRSTIATMSAIVREDAPQLGPEIPKQFSTIVTTCLAKDPAARYQSIADIQTALQVDGTISSP